MKKIITLMLALLPLMASAQWKPENKLPYNVLTPQDSSSKFDAYSYAAHEDFSKYLKSAGKDIITSLVFDAIGVASVVVGTQQNNPEVSKILYVAGVGCGVIGVVFILNAGLDLIGAAEAHRSIHPTPNGVSIDLN
jgi:hypothetical protein